MPAATHSSITYWIAGDDDEGRHRDPQHHLDRGPAGDGHADGHRDRGDDRGERRPPPEAGDGDEQQPDDDADDRFEHDGGAGRGRHALAAADAAGHGDAVSEDGGRPAGDTDGVPAERPAGASRDRALGEIEPENDGASAATAEAVHVRGAGVLRAGGRRVEARPPADDDGAREGSEQVGGEHHRDRPDGGMVRKVGRR